MRTLCFHIKKTLKKCYLVACKQVFVLNLYKSAIKKIGSKKKTVVLKNMQNFVDLDACKQLFGLNSYKSAIKKIGSKKNHKSLIF